MTGSALEGLRVVDLTSSLPGALATQFLADAGADVLLVEPPTGTSLRANPAWPSLGRGKRSAVVDLRTDAGLAELHALLADADVLVTSFRPGTLGALGLTGEELADRHPHLVSASITGWGSSGPFADRKGYEALVMAKLGFFHTKKLLAPRPGPAFISVPFASAGAAQEAVQGILAALLEREASGLGQHVEADLVRGAHALDTWQWFTELVGIRWPDAYRVTEAFSEKYEVLAPLIYPLLVAPTKDGQWIQFAQVEPRLFAAFMEELGLTGLFSDPKWAGLPVLPTQELRTELWETMLGKVMERTLSEWERVFETNPNISAEPYRNGTQVFDHPQVIHDGRVVVIDDPALGPVKQPSTLAHVDGHPLTQLRPAPVLDASTADFSGERSLPAKGSAPGLPLEGITILDFGLMFAGPFGATVLSDLGARVIKVESLTGDTIRVVQAFPESGGAKVMQGKESVSIDISTEEGIAVIHQLVKDADVVLQAFRAGAAARAKIDSATLRALNPSLVYVNAPGYGTDGPYGARPAYAPSIGAASGLALTDAPGAAHATTTLSEIKQAAAQLNQASAVVPLQADGLSALGVASTMLLGLLARARGQATGDLTATMLGTSMLALQEHLTDYEGRPSPPRVDDLYLGYGALYRMYQASEGWVMLAAPAADEWPALVEALGLDADLEGRGVELAKTLEGVFATRPAAEWEELLSAADIGCVQVHEGSPSALLQTDAQLAATYATTATSPVYDEHLRLKPLVSFSRSGTRALGFQSLGESTDKVLTELGYSAEQIDDLRARKVIG